VPTGIPKSGINKGWFKKGHKPTVLSQKARNKISLVHKGKKNTANHNTKISKNHSRFWLGKKHPKDWKMPSGKNHYNWKGGITSDVRKIRNSLEYKLWRKAVFERDGYICIWCGAKSIKGKKVILNADHIKPFSLFPELRFAIDNGRTLCNKCHSTIGWRKRIIK